MIESVSKTLQESQRSHLSSRSSTYSESGAAVTDNLQPRQDVFQARFRILHRPPRGRHNRRCPAVQHRVPELLRQRPVRREHRSCTHPRSVSCPDKPQIYDRHDDIDHRHNDVTIVSASSFRTSMFLSDLPATQSQCVRAHVKVSGLYILTGLSDSGLGRWCQWYFVRCSDCLLRQ